MSFPRAASRTLRNLIVLAILGLMVHTLWRMTVKINGDVLNDLKSPAHGREYHQGSNSLWDIIGDVHVAALFFIPLPLPHRLWSSEQAIASSEQPGDDDHPLPHVRNEIPPSILQTSESTTTSRFRLPRDTNHEPPIFMIGAMKAGTSFTFDLLHRHHQIVPPRKSQHEPKYMTKEVHFFSSPKRYKEGLEFYWQRVSHAGMDIELE